VVVLASTTGIGGGTLRDIILDAPVFWLHDQSYLYSILIAAFITIIWLNRNKDFPQIVLEIADALGLAFFMVMGVQKALNYGMPAMTAVIMGTMTACFGGMIRDVLARQTPMVLKSELYATTCIFGGVVYTQMINFTDNTELTMLVSMSATLILRMSALKWRWSLPVFHHGKAK
jgi:uncharacterized membrane protein YeiH